MPDRLHFPAIFRDVCSPPENSHFEPKVMDGLVQMIFLESIGPRKKNTSYFPLYCLVNRDPYFMVYFEIPI